MSEQPKWLPSDDEMDRARVEAALLRETFGPESDDNAPIRALIRAAVEKALAEQEALKVTDVLGARVDARMPAASDGPAEHLIAGLKMVRHYETLLREQEARHLKAIELANTAYKQQEARHRREVIETRFNELSRYGDCACPTRRGGLCECCARLDAMRAELAALDKEAE